MDIYNFVAKLRKSLKSYEHTNTLEKIYRSVLPKNIRSRILKRGFKDKYGNRNICRVNIEKEEITFSTHDHYSKKWFFPECEDGLYEPEVTSLFARLVRSSAGVIDVGANLGWFTCISSVLSDANVYAFEMDVDNVKRLNRNVIINDCKSQVRVENRAVTDNTKGVSYSKKKGDPGLGYTSLETWKGMEQVEVESTTLDAYFEDEVDKIGLIKVDVEGAELKVIRGGKKLIQNFHPDMIVEIHPKRLSKKDIKRLVKIIKEHGYSTKKILKKDSSDFRLEDIKYGKFNPEENTTIYAHKEE